MLLKELFEAPGKEVAIIFGRFNPPHKGHKAAWEMAAKSPVWYVGTNKSTIGPKDPLPFDVKIQAMEAIWPEVATHIVAETSWLTLASKVYEKHGDVTLYVLTDEDWVTKALVQYNGKEGPHGFYNFSKIEQRPTPRLSSATALRDAVVKGDRDAFADAAGVPADLKVAGKPFFDLVAEYLLPYANAPKKEKKSKAVAESQINEAVPLILPALAAAARIGAPAIGRLLGRGAAGAAKVAAKNPKTAAVAAAAAANPETAVDIANIAKNTYNLVSDPQAAIAAMAQGVYNSAADAAKDIAAIVGDNLTPDAIKGIAAAAAKYALPAAAIVAMLYGGKKLYDYLSSSKAAPAEDAAGVGIITKQNTTGDVNKGSIRKNLKAFNL